MGGGWAGLGSESMPVLQLPPESRSISFSVSTIPSSHLPFLLYLSLSTHSLLRFPTLPHLGTPLQVQSSISEVMGGGSQQSAGVKKG